MIPCFHCGSREEVGGLSRSGSIVDPRLAGHDFVSKGRHLSADDTDRSGAGVGDEARLVVAKDELPNERQGLRVEYQAVQDNRKKRC